MERREVDANLERLDAAAARILTNLGELDQSPTRGLLDVADLQGATQREWAAACAAFQELFRFAATLNAVLDDARRAGEQWPMTPQRLERYQTLVLGPSVVLSASPVVVADRVLLDESGAVVRCTPDALIAQMERAYDQPRTVMRAVASVWDGIVPVIASVRARCAVLLSDVESLAPDIVAGIAAIDERAQHVGEIALVDPLGLDPTEVERLAADADDVAARARRSADVVQRFDAHLDEARAVLADMKSAEIEAARAAEHARSRIGNPSPPSPPTPNGTLSIRLTTLSARANARAAAAELDTWLCDARARLQALAEVVGRCRQLLAERDELRERLRAYEAKAAHLGRVEDASLHSRMLGARNTLYAAPVDLELAARLVRDDQHALSEGSIS